MYKSESEGVAEKLARSQVIFREMNERIAELDGQWGVTELSVFVCECSNQQCTLELEITPAEYEQVRADGARFVVAPGHQLPEVERVVEDEGRYLVVEKFGPAATVARDFDPRHV